MKFITPLLLVLILCVPTASEAGFKSGFKKAAVKVGHVMENTVYVIAATVAVIAFCKAGGCN